MYYYIVTKTPAWRGIDTLGNMARQYRWVTPIQQSSPVNGTPPCHKRAPTSSITKISGEIGAVMSAASKTKNKKASNLYAGKMWRIDLQSFYYLRYVKIST